MPTGLTPDAFISLVVGTDLLVPVSAPDSFGCGPLGVAGDAGGAGAPAGLQRGFGTWPHSRDDAAVERQGAVTRHGVHLTTCGSTADHGAPGPGHGVAADTMAAEDLAAGRLVDAGGGHFSISVEIRLFRPLRRQSQTAEAFWKAISRQSAAQGRE